MAPMRIPHSVTGAPPVTAELALLLRLAKSTGCVEIAACEKADLDAAKSDA